MIFIWTFCRENWKLSSIIADFDIFFISFHRGFLFDYSNFIRRTIRIYLEKSNPNKYKKPKYLNDCIFYRKIGLKF